MTDERRAQVLISLVQLARSGDAEAQARLKLVSDKFPGFGEWVREMTTFLELSERHDGVLH